jgi:branched-chain amino acid transport system permease protein
MSADVSATPPAGVASRRAADVTTRLLGTSRRRVVLILALVAVAIFFSVANDDQFQIVNVTMIYAIAVLGLNVLSGYAGQISLGIAFFMGIGAYTATWLGGTPPTSPRAPVGLGLPFWIWLPAAGIVAALLGALIGPTALRLKGFYLGIVSLALVVIGVQIFKNAAFLTGGNSGRGMLPPAFGDTPINQQNDLFGIALSAGQQFFLVIAPILALAALFVANVMRTRAGRAFQAVRDHEVGAAIMGVNLFEAKMGAFILSSFLAGISGALFASYNVHVDPNTWDLTLSIAFVAAIIIGGIASVWGSLLGAIFVFALPKVLDVYSLVPATGIAGLPSGDVNTVIYGLLIIVFLLFEPAGFVGLIRRGRLLALRMSERNRKGGEPTPAAAGADPGGDAEIERTRLTAGSDA